MAVATLRKFASRIARNPSILSITRSSASPLSLTNHWLVDPDSHRLEDINACSSECEVHISQEWLEKLPEASYDEQYVLKRNSRARVLSKHSRLGCQVVLSPELQGMVVTIPEAKPWDIP
ncbi:unnamed protein product [Withania somnifera]